MVRTENGNSLLFYGGGNCDCASVLISEMANRIDGSYMFKKTFVGFYSFECLINKMFIKEWNMELYERAKRSRGGFFGTSRGVDLTKPEFQEIAIKTCKEKNIKWIFVAGGDGSSRQVAEIAEAFEAEGIKLAFVMPMTIDGIEGGLSLGLVQAVRISQSIVYNLVETCLRTRDHRDAYSIVAIELQGRNRDDIEANLLKELCSSAMIADFEREEIDIIAVPANYKCTVNALMTRVNSSKKPTLILISEGADIKLHDLPAMFTRKTRTFSVGHLSQMNGFTSVSDENKIRELVRKLVEVIKEEVGKEKSFSLVTDFDKSVRVEPIDYFAKLNPRSGQKVTLAPELENLIKKYLP